MQLTIKCWLVKDTEIIGSEKTFTAKLLPSAHFITLITPSLKTALKSLVSQNRKLLHIHAERAIKG